MPSPPSTRPSDAQERRSFAFVREDLGRAPLRPPRGSSSPFGSRRSSRPSFAYAIWLISRVMNVDAKIACHVRPQLARSSMREKVTLNHPIFTRWPAQYADRLQLFSAPTPNGVKVGIMLEETSLAYEPHRIDIMADENHDPAFLALNPNGKIPAIATLAARMMLQAGEVPAVRTNGQVESWRISAPWKRQYRFSIG